MKSAKMIIRVMIGSALAAMGCFTSHKDGPNAVRDRTTERKIGR